MEAEQDDNVKESSDEEAQKTGKRKRTLLLSAVFGALLLIVIYNIYFISIFKLGSGVFSWGKQSEI